MADERVQLDAAKPHRCCGALWMTGSAASETFPKITGRSFSGRTRNYEAEYLSKLVG